MVHVVSSPYLKKRIYASLLADGGLIQPKPNVSNIFFQFTQAANIISKTGESHLEYACWFLGQMDPEILTPAPFSLERGLAVQSPQKDALIFTWKARVTLWNLDFFAEAFADNYNGFSEDISRTDEFIKFTSRGSLSFFLQENFAEEETVTNAMSQDETPDQEIDNFGIFEESLDIQENFSEETNSVSLDSNSSSNVPARKQKNLPPYNKLKNDYLADPGFSIAHMHMQDGDLYIINNSVRIPRLFIQTTEPIPTLYLSKAIYEASGLKYLPITYHYTTKKSPLVTVLYLCPSSVNLFVELMEKHMLPCMEYKNPARLNMESPAIVSVLNDFDTRFEDFARKFF